MAHGEDNTGLPIDSVFEILNSSRRRQILHYLSRHSGRTELSELAEYVVAVERDGQDPPITPRGDTRIEAGDVITVYSGFGAGPELTDVFGHHGDHPR